MTGTDGGLGAQSGKSGRNFYFSPCESALGLLSFLTEWWPDFKSKSSERPRL